LKISLFKKKKKKKNESRPDYSRKGNIPEKEIFQKFLPASLAEILSWDLSKGIGCS